ncbi:MAG: M23 family metallopeptidase [Sulfurimonas sp.]|nr:M23 family metallopeptidase [Sulfurimonas sp.]
MLLKLLLLFTFLVTLLYAKDYPQTYDRLGTPLFKASEHFIKYEDVISLKVLIKEYVKRVDTAVENGKKADLTQDSVKKKSYLLELRKLQSLYDVLLYSLHKNISKSIQDDNYTLFLKLTSYAFDGLFINTNLRNEAIAFYIKHKQEQTSQCLILEKNIADEKLYTQTKELFAAEIIHSSYSSQTQEKSKKSVYITTKRDENRIEVLLHNKNIYDVTIRVKYTIENIKLGSKPPKEFVLKAQSSYHYTTLILGSGKSRYGFNWSYIMGSKDAQHNNDYIYRLPFKKGMQYRVSQGYNGADTHKGSSAYSIDFPMPVGTKIYAARDGVVVKTKSNSDIGGYDKKYASSGNYVRILHNDGTFATYYHLKYGGVLVNVGEEVSKGEPLGYSGSTGYSSGPHLHFSVFRAKSGGKRVTIPTKFRTREGLLENPIRGKFYEAI